MKRGISLVLVMALCFCMIACSGNKPAQNDDKYTKIGTSEYSIILPDGYAETEDEFEEDQIAYYFKDDQSIDFDVYQWDKEEKYTLKEEAAYFASEYNATAEEIEINGISGMKYISKEVFDDNEYTVVNYMFEDEKSIVELSFWTIDTEEEYKAVDEIIGSIKKN